MEQIKNLTALFWILFINVVSFYLATVKGKSNCFLSVDRRVGV